MTYEELLKKNNNIIEENKNLIQEIRNLRCVMLEAANHVNIIEDSELFKRLISDADSTLVVVARFLSLLELYREGVVRFEQMVSLGELQITWVGTAHGEVRVSDEFDVPVQTIDEADNV